MSVSTKIEISIHDFKASLLGNTHHYNHLLKKVQFIQITHHLIFLGAKVRQRLEVMTTIKKALELGLVSLLQTGKV